MSVPTLSIIFIIMNMLLGVITPIALCVFFYKKFKCDLVVFGIGCAVMFFFALILEQIVHTIVLSSPAGITIQANIWLYALYGGLMAGLFEETGRFVAMKFLLKKQQDNNYNALMYGAGHGGFEVFYILVFGMINNLLYSLMLNSGNAEALLAPLDTGTRAIMEQAFAVLAGTPSVAFLAAPVERGAAVLAQISLSVLVWFAAKGNVKWYPIAILLHALLNIVGVVVNATVISVVITESAIWAVAIGYVFLAKKVWKKETAYESEGKF